MAKTLRPYQIEAQTEAFNSWREGFRSILLVMATGTGKTVTCGEIISKVVKKTAKKVLFLAHRKELIAQAYKTFDDMGLQPAVEMAEETTLARLEDFSVVVGSVQTLSSPRRLERFVRDDFVLIVIDESHHATSVTYRKVVDFFPGVKVLGLTATPYRTDKVGLKNVFDKVAFQYPIQQGIEEGFLCPIISKQVKVDSLHLDSLEVKKGEFDESQITEMLIEQETLQQMVRPTIELMEKRPTIVFCNDVAHATAITQCFQSILGPRSAVLVHGALNHIDRSRAFTRFESGESQYLINVQVCTEGYDHPPTAGIALFRPMKSLGLLCQCCGRGTRIHPGKENCVILDYVGASDSVQTVNVLDVLDGTIIDGKTKKKALKLTDAGIDAMEALKRAKKEIADERAQEQKLKASMSVVYKTTASNMLELFGLPSSKGLFGGERATGKQIALIEKNGIQVDRGFEKGEAMKLIGSIFDRRKEGLCTVKQAKFLASKGVQDAWEMKFEDASKLIGSLIGTK